MSTRTTYFGPRVSFRTSLSDAGPVHVRGDSSSTFEWDGKVDLSGGNTYSRQTTASYASTTLNDGEFAVGDVSVTSAVLYFRSGVTTYQFIADAGSVL